MRTLTRIRRLAGWWAVAAALVLLVAPASAQAQSGRIAGTVVDDAGNPVSDAEVTVVGTRLGTFANDAGEFAIRGVRAGTHTLRVRQLGYADVEVEGVTVSAGETATVEVTLTPKAFEMGDIVVSASRQAERITDAPATVTRIDERDLQRTVGNSFTGALAGVKGLDYIQVGVTAAAVNARGFNSSFNNRMLMVIDDRIGVLPENGLPVGQFTTIPKIDLESVEVLVGPGAALYGADASNGVISMTTKDPREHQGTTVEVTGGNRDYRDVQFRHAGVTDDGSFGFKVAGEWQAAHDFENYLQHDVDGELVREKAIDWDTQVGRVEGAGVYYGDEYELELAGGFSETDAVGQTNVGRNQLEDWTYNFQQVKLSSDHLYASLYRTQSQSGQSYAINRFTQNRVLNPDASFEEVRQMSDWPSDGQLYVANVQGNFRVPELLNTRFVLGGQYRHDRVSSDEQWLTDRNTGEPIGIDQGGVYAQTETPLTSKLRLVLGARYDEHQDYESQFSPKAGLLFSPVPDQTIRFTYNRAFKSPTTLQTRFFIPDFVTAVGVFGNAEGFTVRDAGGEVLQTIDPLVPETNDTWELGYKGVIGERLYLDGTFYYSDYQDFLGSLLPINNPYAEENPTFAYRNDEVIVGEPPGELPQIVLTYQNLGAAQIWGSDIGARYALSPKVSLNGSFSVLEVSDIENPNPESQGQATAVNSTPVKWSLGADFQEIGGRGFGGVLLRHVTGYHFSSGINDGHIPTFNTLNLYAGLDLPVDGVSAQLTANNLFTCREVLENDPVTPNAEPGTSCGFDEGHVEMINMPAQETTVMLGLRWHQ